MSNLFPDNSLISHDYSMTNIFKSLTIILCILLFSGCGVIYRGAQHSATNFKNSTLFWQGRHGELTDKEKIWAAVAWTYFENNVNPETGLVNSVDRYPTTTMWHVADYLAALVAAKEFELIDSLEFDHRLSQVLKFLNTMDLFFGRLPNKVYNTKTGKMVNYANQNEEIGWSAVDLGRLLLWLKIVSVWHPIYSEYVDKIVLRWSFCDLLDRCGLLYGGTKIQGKIDLYQEGRLGYEEYAALGYRVWGFDTRQSSSIEPYQLASIFGVDIAHDGRDPRETGTFSPVVTLPYVLTGIEINWDNINDTFGLDSSHSDSELSNLADKIYQVQALRYEKEKIFTARTDHQLGKAPFFVYDSIFAAGYAWNTISDGGDVYNNLSLVSTRAAFGLWALWKTEYTTRLIEVLEALYDKDRGWYEGRYELTGGYDNTITASTNTVILEALLHKSRGKLYSPPDESSYGEILLQDEFKRPGRCFPPERKQCPLSKQ